MVQFQEYIPLLKLILIPTMVVLACFIVQRWIFYIVEMLKKLNEFLIAFNRASFLLLGLYVALLVYFRIT